jgi:hypothetical protein
MSTLLLLLAAPALLAQSLSWTDVKQANLEGQAWRDTKAPFDRFPPSPKPSSAPPSESRKIPPDQVRFATDSAAIHAT